MLDKLKELGIESIMLTGDPSPQARVMAESLGMQHAYNGLSPMDKVNHIQQLQAKGAIVLMVEMASMTHLYWPRQTFRPRLLALQIWHKYLATVLF